MRGVGGVAEQRVPHVIRLKGDVALEGNWVQVCLITNQDLSHRGRTTITVSVDFEGKLCGVGLKIIDIGAGAVR